MNLSHKYELCYHCLNLCQKKLLLLLLHLLDKNMLNHFPILFQMMYLLLCYNQTFVFQRN
uniref:Uncharacterized protein n=1 Tax=uncultured marine virus TaxID=186617 RepID=A0A0F7LBG3_9VIRU|nr:hypothetical protein [uncultured marine virus]